MFNFYVKCMELDGRQRFGFGPPNGEKLVQEAVLILNEELVLLYMISSVKGQK